MQAWLLDVEKETNTALPQTIRNAVLASSIDHIFVAFIINNFLDGIITLHRLVVLILASALLQIMPKVSLVFSKSTDKAIQQSNEIPIIFSIESDYTHGVDDDSVLSAIKHNKEISLVSHFSRLQAEWNPDFNHRFIAAFSGDFGDRHCGTQGSFQRHTEIDGLEDSIEESRILGFEIDFEIFKVQFGGVEKTFPSSDVRPFLLSILMENDDVDMRYEDSLFLEESCYYRLISSATVFNFEMQARYLRMDVKKIKSNST